MASSRFLPRRPVEWVELFAAANLGFLAVDVAIAHSANSFASRAEWVPVAFSVAAPLLLAAAFLRGGLDPAAPMSRAAGFAVGGASVVVGVAGMLLHLKSQFFEDQSLRKLVYTAPFVAPLAYAGLGLLLVLDRMEAPDGKAWSRWVVLLALGGFVGNFGLSLADHAQDGFFDRREWIPVVAAALAVGFLLVAVARHEDRAFAKICLGVAGVEAAVGVLGSVFHLTADVSSRGGTLWTSLVYGAPPFAPMLFADLALLAAIGLVAMRRADPPGAANPPHVA